MPGFLLKRGASLDSTSAALAAALRASSLSLRVVPPRVWPWPLIFGTGARDGCWGGGAVETVRPGWEKGSESDCLPQRLPILLLLWGCLTIRCGG